ncbi:hypothetical protein FACS189432_03950 [Bacteroidia bacterium]|nr:hypothetical protein FACS189432_03950 [Bacteroidia bacterium]
MKIQIFLASSVDEFKYDRLTVGDFINRLNKLYHKDMDDPKYDSVQDLFFVLEKCEDEDNSIVAQGEIQDRIDSKIVGSDFVFLLFGKTIKKWTKHEFRYACGILKKTGKPKIVVYMRTATDEGELITQDEEAEKFKSRLMSKNYIGKYAHIDTLLFNIVMYIIAMDIDSVKINVSNEILKDGDTEILSLKNVPAWSANDALLQAQEELNKLEERYLKLKTEWLKKGHREEVNIEYKTVAAEYEKKREETQMLRIRVFDDLCLASKAILSGGLTERQSRAYQLMEEGKWKEANILLNFNDIKNDCQNLIELKKKNDELKSVAIETGKQIKTQAQGFLDELLLKIRLSTSFARNSTDFDKIHEFYIEAIRHSQHFDLPQEVLFLYAQFLKEQHKDTKALKYAMDYCNCKSVSDLTKQAAALMFTVNLLNQNEKKYELSQKYWQKAIAIWSRIFDEHKKTDLQNDKDLLCEFHNFILESADYILSNKFFHGEEEFIGPVMTRFRSLHDLCTAVRKRYDIAIKFPECIPDSYVKMIANRIFHSEPKEAPTSWDEVRKERDSFLHYEAITPFNQGEELLVYAYIIMNKLKEEMPSDKDVLRYFAKSNCYLSSLIINADPIVSRQMLSLSVDIYEKLALSNDSPQTKLDIALVYTNLGQTFLSEDLKNHNKTNEKKVVKLHNKAITLYEELYRDNPDIYYLNLIMAYSLKAEHIRKYRYDDKRDISVDEVKAINKLLEISNTMSKSGVEFPINITRTIVNDVRRFIWLMLPFNFNHVEIVELNYKYAIAICEKYKKKYPKAFSLELFNTYFDYFKFLSYNKSEFTFALSFLKKRLA